MNSGMSIALILYFVISDVSCIPSTFFLHNCAISFIRGNNLFLISMSSEFNLLLIWFIAELNSSSELNVSNACNILPGLKEII